MIPRIVECYECRIKFPYEQPGSAETGFMDRNGNETIMHFCPDCWRRIKRRK